MKTAVLRRNAGLNTVFDYLDAGATLNLYKGTVPTDSDTALSGNTLMAAHSLAHPAFGAASGGTKTGVAVPNATILASGVPTFASLVMADGTTRVADLSVGITGSGADVILPTDPGTGTTVISYVAGATSTISALSVSQAA